MATQFTFKAIGTSWTIDIYADVSSEDGLLSAIKERIDGFDKVYSRFRADSLVTEMSKKAGEYILPDDASKMLSLYRELYEFTGGKMTPLIGDTLVDAGYDASYSLAPKAEIHKAKEWDEAIKYEHPKLLVKQPVMLDFGAIGKGYLIDLVGELLENNEIHDYMINAGGDIRQRTSFGKNLRVGLENPENQNEVIGVVQISNQSICGSAGNRRAWGKFHHIIDPDTAESPRGILSLWVVAKETYLADALTTALFFVSPETLREKYEFEYAIVSANHSVLMSENFPGQLFT